MKTLKIKDVMTAQPMMIGADQTAKMAAQLMQEYDCGILPVGTSAKVVGMVSDRDIAIRIVAEGKDPAKTPVRDIMSKPVYLCEEGDSLLTAAQHMRHHDVSRLIVSDGKTITGIVTLADLLRNQGDCQQSDETLHVLLGPQESKPFKAKEMGCAGAGSESCDVA